MKKITIFFIVILLFSGCTIQKTEVEVQTDEGIESDNHLESVPVKEQSVGSEKVTEPFVEVTRPTNLIFEYIDTEQDERIEQIVNDAYIELTEEFELSSEEEIKFNVYKDQPSFWEAAFGGENNGRTTGFANHVDRIVYLTSPTDTSIKPEAEMLKVPIHELVHILLPHEYIDIREGIAYYLAGQTKAFSLEEIPSNLTSIVTYEGGVDCIRMQYNLAGYQAKFMIEECLDMDFKRYKEFMDQPENYEILGYEDQGAFVDDFRTYLEDKANR